MAVKIFGLGCRCGMVDLGNITDADVNAAAASSSITITLPGTGIPTGYAITGVWLETVEAFVSASATIQPTTNAFISATADSSDIIAGLPINGGFLSTVTKIFATPSKAPGVGVIGVADMSVDNYTGGIDVSLSFIDGGFNPVNNPQNFSAGNLRVIIELSKVP